MAAPIPAPPACRLCSMTDGQGRAVRHTAATHRAVRLQDAVDALDALDTLDDEQRAQLTELAARVHGDGWDQLSDTTRTPLLAQAWLNLAAGRRGGDPNETIRTSG